LEADAAVLAVVLGAGDRLLDQSRFAAATAHESLLQEFIDIIEVVDHRGVGTPDP
jgi:hypothetical protein